MHGFVPVSCTIQFDMSAQPKYFLYARKSSEDDDRQVMSIEAQLFELREYARREQLEILKDWILTCKYYFARELRVA